MQFQPGDLLELQPTESYTKFAPIKTKIPAMDVPFRGYSFIDIGAVGLCLEIVPTEGMLAYTRITGSPKLILISVCGKLYHIEPEFARKIS